MEENNQSVGASYYGYRPLSQWNHLGVTCDYLFTMSIANSKKSRCSTKQPRLIDATEPSDDEREPIAKSFSERNYTYAPNVAYIRRPPKDYRIMAVLSALFCFLPLGFFSIYYSIKVNSFYQRGDISNASRASDRTRLLIQLTVITGCVI